MEKNVATVLFLIAFAMLVGACYLVASKDNSAYEGVSNIYRNLNVEIKRLQEMNDKMTSTANILIADKGKEIQELSRKVDELSKKTVIQVETLPVRLEPGSQNKLRRSK